MPTLEQLYEWTREPDHRVVIRGANWAFYERIIDVLGDRSSIHVDYDGKDLEIMAPSLYHDGERRLMAQLIDAVAQELEVPYSSLGQTTWKRPELSRGLEADECYFFRAEKLQAVALARARKARSVLGCPNPDLAVEIDISPSKIDRPGIYSALEVTELWRFDGAADEVIIEQLGPDGRYHPAEESVFLPIRASEIRRWILDEASSDESAWARRLRAWARAELAPRLHH